MMILDSGLLFLGNPVYTYISFLYCYYGTLTLFTLNAEYL